MNQTNQFVLKMVLASPVGQALSDADREALKQTLETTDAREVQGWLGDQIRKAAVVFKGDYDGHPFRGNQHSDSSGASQGGAGSGSREPRRRGKDIDDLSVADQKEYEDRMNQAKTKAEQREIIAEFKARLDGSGSPRFGYGSGAKISDLKEGDFADIDTKNSQFVGTILGIKNGVVTFDDVDKGEIEFKLKDVEGIDGDRVGQAKETSSEEGKLKLLRNLKEGDFADLDTHLGMSYAGTVLSNKNGVITFDDVDQGEIKISSKDISHLDGKMVNSPPRTETSQEELARLADGARAAEDAKYKNNPELLARDVAAARIRGAAEQEARLSQPPMSLAGKRTVAAANRSLKSFQEVKDELEAVEASRDQIIDDLVDEEGISRKNAKESVDDDIAILRYAVKNSKFKDAQESDDDKKIREVSEQAGKREQDRQKQERRQTANETRRGKLIPLNEDNAEDSLKGDEAKEFKGAHKAALDSVKQTRALIAELRVKAQGLKGQRRDDADAALQEAQEETDGFESIVRENSKPTFYSAVSISAMGTNRGESAKGLIRVAMRAIGVKGDSRDSLMQEAGDKNFGVDGDKYDVEGIYDTIGL